MSNSISALKKEILLLNSTNQSLREKVEYLEHKSTENFNWPKIIIDSIPNPIFIKDENFSFIVVNIAFCKFVGMQETELVGKKDSDFFPIEQVKIFAAIDEEVMETGVPKWNEEQLTVGKEILNLLTSKVRINDSEGNKFLLGLITNITGNKNQQIALNQKKEELEIEKQNAQNLLNEVHHRVNNNLQVISSLLNLQRNSFKDNLDDTAKNILKDCSHRILAMANVHKILYSNSNFSQLNFKPYIENLIENLSVSFSLEDRIEFNLKLRSFHLNVKKAVPLGLAINEIITNAIKHAKNELSHLKIDIRIIKINGQIRIEIEDNGGGSQFDLSNKTNSLGIDLIHLFCNQIGAEVIIDNSTKGLKFTLIMPTKQTTSIS